MKGEYPNTRRVVYENGMTFVPVCERCGRFVVSDFAIPCSYANDLLDEPNATCSKCGRTKMLFEGFI